MAQAVDELARQGSPAYQSAQDILGTLLKAEMAEREVRSIAYQMKASRFPVYRDLASFDFAQIVANEALIRQLHRCEFLDQVHNVVLVGGPGTASETAQLNPKRRSKPEKYPQSNRSRDKLRVGQNSMQNPGQIYAQFNNLGQFSISRAPLSELVFGRRQHGTCVKILQQGIAKALQDNVLGWSAFVASRDS